MGFGRRDVAHSPDATCNAAADAIGLLDHLGVDRAHIVGASMGGMIVQTMAIEHADRVASMVSIHGRDDTLITLSGGERTAELTPGANLLVLDDMGHDLPEPLWPLIVGAITGHITASAGVGASV